MARSKIAPVVACAVFAKAVWTGIDGTAFIASFGTGVRPTTAPDARVQPSITAAAGNVVGGSSWAAVGASAAATAALAATMRRRGLAAKAKATEEDLEAPSRRSAAAAIAAIASFGVAAAPAFAEIKEAEVDLPPRINSDPYELLGISNPDDAKVDRESFRMKRNYREDTYQVLKHMKISGSLDKGTPQMEKYQQRVKQEMDDWVALYRRQDSVVGRQSYYSLYSGVNTLASHLVSYGPKFPFPNKRRPRLYQLINQTEKYLEKKK